MLIQTTGIDGQFSNELIEPCKRPSLFFIVLVSFFGFGAFAWDLSLKNFRVGYSFRIVNLQPFACNISLVSRRLGLFVWDLSFAIGRSVSRLCSSLVNSVNSRLGAFAWDCSSGAFRLGGFA